MAQLRTFDVAVVGAFGVWTAFHLRRAGLSVALLEAHGIGHGRATSGGETRVTRMGYGPDAIYTRMALASLPQWIELEMRASAPIFVPTGVLWLAREDDAYSLATLRVLREQGVPHERIDGPELVRRYPQMSFDGIRWGILEPGSGVLMARRAVRALGAELQAQGVVLLPAIAGLVTGASQPEARLSSSGSSSGGRSVL